MDIEQIKTLLEEKTNEINSNTAETKSKIDTVSKSVEELKTANKDFVKNSEILDLKSSVEDCKKSILELSRNGAGNKVNTEEKEMQLVDSILRKNLMQRVEITSMEIKDPTQGAVGADPFGTTGPLGGYAVPFALDRNILKAERDLNVMRQLCSSQTVSTPETFWNVDKGGTEVGWIGELTARPNTNVPQLDRVGINWGEIYANPKASYRLLDDAGFNVESWYSNSVAEAFADSLEEAFITGDGTNKPKGILSYTFETATDDTRDFQKFQKVSGALTSDSILSLYYSLRQVYRKNGCSWLMAGSTIEAIRKLKDGQGNYIWVDNMADGMRGTLLGLPVYESRFMPKAETGTNAILFGNFKKAYTIFDLYGLRIVRDIYTDKSSVSFYTSKRVGNMVKDSCALKALNISA